MKMNFVSLVITVIVAALLGLYVMSTYFDEDQITEGRFNYYGGEPTSTTLPPTPEPWQPPPDPIIDLPPEPKVFVPADPTPFETGPKVRPPTGCDEGEARGVDC